ncbi:MAG TPA: DUF6659 family protein [Nitrosopumilaceae archaeon]|nr:DUF6659 family protein [Nitrosopumilaceae archaeon]
MSNLSFANSRDWGSVSKRNLNLPEIRFVGVINHMGRPMMGDYKKEIIPIAEIKYYNLCMEHALELFMKKDLDGILGPLDYIVSKRKNIVIIIVPVNNHVVLISAEPNAKIESIIEDILQQLKFQQ